LVVILAFILFKASESRIKAKTSVDATPVLPEESAAQI
jgi:hypothetical protein